MSMTSAIKHCKLNKWTWPQMKTWQNRIWSGTLERDWSRLQLSRMTLSCSSGFWSSSVCLSVSVWIVYFNDYLIWRLNLLFTCPFFTNVGMSNPSLISHYLPQHGAILVFTSSRPRLTMFSYFWVESVFISFLSIYCLIQGRAQDFRGAGPQSRKRATKTQFYVL